MTITEKLERKERPRLRRFHKKLRKQIEYMIRTATNEYEGPELYEGKIYRYEKIKKTLSELRFSASLAREINPKVSKQMRSAREELEKSLPSKEEREWYTRAQKLYFDYLHAALDVARGSHLYSMIPGQYPDSHDQIRYRRKTALKEMRSILKEEPNLENVKVMTKKLEEITEEYLFKIPASRFSNVSGNK